jgi:hypothetical protein
MQLDPRAVPGAIPEIRWNVDEDRPDGAGAERRPSLALDGSDLRFARFATVAARGWAVSTSASRTQTRHSPTPLWQAVALAGT